MDYSDDYLRSFLPREDPPAALVPGDVIREVARRSERERADDADLLARSVKWTYAIFSEIGLGNYRSRGGPASWGPFFPGLSALGLPHIIIGLYDPAAEEAGFGLSLNIPAWDGPPFLVFDHLYFPRLGQEFPVALRQVETELHAAVNPSTATSACWARCNSTQEWGIVTAGHAVGGNFPGLPVPLDDGTTGTLRRCFWQPVDAAFVAVTAPPPVLPAPLPVMHFPAAGLPVTVEGRGHAKSRKVASACNSQGFYSTRLFPILFYLDLPCDPGDSGALVRLSSGEAGGIYNGSQPSPASGGNSGLVLNFAQAMFALDTTPYL